MIAMISYRVWDKKEKKMYYDGFLIGTAGELYRISNAMENRKNEYKMTLLPVSMENFDVMRCLSGRKDISHSDVYEKDILRYETGCEFCVEYGTHDAFCSGDKLWGSNEGFVAAAYDAVAGSDHNDIYPLMEIETLALCVGNIYEGYHENDDDLIKGIDEI